MDALTLAAVLGGGTVAAAGFIAGLVEVLKREPHLGLVIRRYELEQAMALVFSAVIVVAAVLQVPALTPEEAFGAILSWYGIARLALGIHDDFTQQPGSLTGPAA